MFDILDILVRVFSLRKILNRFYKVIFCEEFLKYFLIMGGEGEKEYKIKEL